METPGSPFFDIPQSEWIAYNRSAFAIWDGYPVSPGHALVITRRQISDWWEATPGERADIFELVDSVRAKVEAAHRPDGFNVGFNAGVAAGQTVDHLHVHVIPRYAGDVPDPRGGIRYVIEANGNYSDDSVEDRRAGATESHDMELSPVANVLVDGTSRIMLPELIRHLRHVKFDRIDIVVSFIKVSGLSMLIGPLEDALQRGAQARILTTDYMGLTEPAALSLLHDLMDGRPEQLIVRVFHDRDISFHPKAYLFYSSDNSIEAAFVGSSNISGQGLAGGIEWNLLVGAIHDLKERFSVLWGDPRSLPLTEDLIGSYQPAPVYVQDEYELPENPDAAPQPRPIQEEALTALAQTREDGFRAGMVTMATGLGKTWLAAFDVARPEVQRVLFIAHREEILRQSRDVFRRVVPDATMGLYYGGEKRPDADFVFAAIQTLSRNLDRFASDSFDYIVVDEFHHAAASTYRQVLDHFTPDFLLGLTATPERMDGADLLALCADNLVFQCDLVEGIRREELVPFHYWGVPDPVDFEPIPWRNGKFDLVALEQAIETQERAQAAFDEWQSRRGSRTLMFCASQHHSDFMSEFFQARGVRCVSVHSGPTSAPRFESIKDLRTGAVDVICTVDLFNEGLDVPEIDTVLMLRPTESPVVFLQQLGRGLRTHQGKERLAVIDFIGNHRSFLLKPRTLLSLGRTEAPSTLQVLAALESNDFGLPAGCAVDYQLTVVEMLRELTRTSTRDAIEEYCRSYTEEEGLRPTAAQAFRAGHDPAIVTTKYGSWFNFLRAIDLLGEQEAVVFDTHGTTLRAIQTETITKSYKLVAMRALLHDGKLRTGDEISHNAETSRELLIADPRLARDVPESEFPDLAGADPGKWVRYWRKWPIAHLTGAGSSGAREDHVFRLVSDRIVPTFAVDDALAGIFDAMVAEILEYRLGSYVLNKEKSVTHSWSCRLAFVDDQPVIRLDRRQHPDLPSGENKFLADGIEYEATFAKGAVVHAPRIGSVGNALSELLRDWFGPSAGHSGTSHYVEFELSNGTLLLRRRDAEATDLAFDFIPLLRDFEVAFEPDARNLWNEHATGEIPVAQHSTQQLATSTHFACFAHSDEPDAGLNAVRRGDPLLFEWLSNDSARACVDQTVLVQITSTSGPTGALRYIHTQSDVQLLRPIARLVEKLDQHSINPLASKIGSQFKSTDVPELYGEVFNPGNWRSGHVSLKSHAILFVSLHKRADRVQYTEHFESPEVFVWSSQLSTAPEGKKGREILGALETGKSIELWMRRKGNDIGFTYLGRVVPLGHEGSKPMLVTFKLLTPLTSDIQSQLGLSW